MAERPSDQSVEQTQERTSQTSNGSALDSIENNGADDLDVNQSVTDDNGLEKSIENQYNTSTSTISDAPTNEPDSEIASNLISEDEIVETSNNEVNRSGITHAFDSESISEEEITGNNDETKETLNATNLELPAVLLNDRYEIYPSSSLPELSSPSGTAFAVKDQKGAYPNLMAIVAIPGMVTRVDVIEEIKGQKLTGLITLMDYGIVDWPLIGKKTSVLVYEQPLGGRVNSVISEEPSDYNKIEMIQTSIKDIVEGLTQLRTRGIAHRAIRHNNIFFLDEAREKVVLGDFLSTPPGFDQPVVYETIENGMANEGAREEGNVNNDLYAFGVTLAFLAQKELPFDDFTKEEIIVSKIDITSFQTIVGKNLITTKVLEPMRGLLLDEKLIRWNIEHLNNWQNGLPNVPNPIPPEHKAHRPIVFGEIHHFSPRTLAYSMSIRPEQAIEIIKDGTLEEWVLKDYMDEDLTPTFTNRLSEIKNNAERSRDKEDFLLSSVLIILDPQAPIRFRECSYIPDSFGRLLITETVRGGDYRSPIASVLNHLPDTWIEINEERKLPNSIEHVNYGRLKTHLQKTGFGFGIERCIYELCWDFPCQSRLFESEFVVHIEELLPALDRIEKNVDPETRLVDRHIAAFIAARVRKSLGTQLQDLSNSDEALSALATLKLLTFLQKQYGPEALKNLTKWIGSQMGPVVKIYQSRSTQRHLETEVPKVVRDGSLTELCELLDDPESRQSDLTEYETAIEGFRSAQKEVEKIQEELNPDSEFLTNNSKQVAVITSLSIMTFVIVIMLFV